MEIRKCVVCSHEWPLRGLVEPKNCPNHKCRSIRWKDGIDNRVNGPPRFVVQVDDDRKGQFERAARAAGKSVPDWLRDLGIAAISPPTQPRTTPTPPDTRSIAGFSRGEPTPVKVTGFGQPDRVISAADQREAIAAIEHAAKAEAPIGRSVTEFLLSKQPAIKVETGVSLSTGQFPAIAPASSNEFDPDAKPFKPWLSEVQRWDRMREVDHEEAAREEAKKLDGRGFKTPKGWSQWDDVRRADYLDTHHPLAGPKPTQTAAPDGW